MTYDTITPSMRRFLGNREGFRRLGFSRDDLYCECARSVELGGQLGLYLTLKTRGQEFRVFCGPAGDEGAVEAEYRALCEAAAAGRIPQGDLQRMWEESEVYHRAADLLRALLLKGIALPDRETN